MQVNRFFLDSDPNCATQDHSVLQPQPYFTAAPLAPAQPALSDKVDAENFILD